MIVAFDALDRYETPLFYVCNPGCELTNGGTLTNVLGPLSDTSDEEIIFNFNAKSELNLRAYKRKMDDNEQNEHFNDIFDALEARRMIYVEDIGFFMISNVTEGYDNYTTYKDVSASSCEAEIENKQVPYIADGTYPFSSTATTQGLLETLVEALPLWQIAHVDTAVSAKYRTFSDVDDTQNVYSFMLEDMQDAYECIFLFDIKNRLISVYDRDTYIRETNIHLTKDDLIQSVSIEESSDDLYTALTVSGDDDSINIAAVNPLGTRTIYNFDYYLDWMTPELRAAVEAWSAKMKDVADDYYNYSIEYYDLLTEALNYASEVSRLDIVVDMYERCRDNIVAESSNRQVASYNRVIAANGGTEISNASDIDELKTEIDSLLASAKSDRDAAIANRDAALENADTVDASMQAIREEVSFSNNFRTALYEELMHYIFEGAYTDEYITVTDIMTQAEKLQQMKVLYDRAVVQLNKISQPTFRFTIDVENFLFQTEFSHATEELETGCIINVELEPNDIAELFLTTIELNWYDRQLTLTFGNRYNKFDPKAMFDSVLGSVTRSANAIEYIKELVSPIASGELNEMQMAIDNSRNLTKNLALTATDNEVQIDDTGYLGRKVLDDGSYDPEQIKIVNNSIVFTNDAWDTAKTAVGKIVLADGTTYYGINAEVLIGDMIIGDTLHIGYYDHSGSVQDLGNVVASVTPQYYLSTSPKSLSGGSWSFDQPASKPAGRYLWTRDLIAYLDSAQEYSYTEPICLDSADITVGARNFVLRSDVDYIADADADISYSKDDSSLSVTTSVLSELSSDSGNVIIEAADGVSIIATQNDDGYYDVAAVFGERGSVTAQYELSPTIPDIAQGNSFILSFYAYTSGSGSVIAALFDNEDNLTGWSESAVIENDAPVRYVISGLTVDDLSVVHTLKLIITANDGFIDVKNVQLEFGDVATSWAPAPEDQEAELESFTASLTTIIHDQGAALDVVQDQISSKVWSQDIETAVSMVDGEIMSLETRVARNESDIIQNANDITLKVSSTDYNGNKIVGLINQTDTTTTISSSRINLHGSVTISDFSSEVTSYLDSIEYKADNADNVIQSWSSSKDATLIDGAKIYTGSLMVEQIKLYGKMNVYESAESNAVGGYVGYMAGATATGITNGIALMSPTSSSGTYNYFIATDAGIRMTNVYNDKTYTSFSISNGMTVLQKDGNIYSVFSAMGEASDYGGIVVLNAPSAQTNDVKIYATDSYGGYMWVATEDNHPAIQVIRRSANTSPATLSSQLGINNSGYGYLTVKNSDGGDIVAISGNDTNGGIVRIYNAARTASFAVTYEWLQRVNALLS